jgi:hypothetical protein
MSQYLTCPYKGLLVPNFGNMDDSLFFDLIITWNSQCVFFLPEKGYRLFEPCIYIHIVIISDLR